MLMQLLGSCAAAEQVLLNMQDQQQALGHTARCVHDGDKHGLPTSDSREQQHHLDCLSQAVA